MSFPINYQRVIIFSIQTSFSWLHWLHRLNAAGCKAGHHWRLGGKYHICIACIHYISYLIDVLYMYDMQLSYIYICIGISYTVCRNILVTTYSVSIHYHIGLLSENGRFLPQNGTSTKKSMTNIDKPICTHQTGKPDLELLEFVWHHYQCSRYQRTTT